MILQQIAPLLVITGIFVIMLIVITVISNYSLNGIKRKKVGDGQHGTARFATQNEINKTYKQIEFKPQLWRQGKELPKTEGLIIGSKKNKDNIIAFVDDGDVHTLMIGASGVGKTAFFLYPNIEYCCAAGMSFICTDSKGDVYRNTASVAEKYYGYNISVIDLRNPTRSDSYNMLYLVNKYMDLYIIAEKEDKKNNRKILMYKAKAEKYAKITAKTIISAGMDIATMGQNAYFYEAAEGLITSMILVIAEFCPPEERHIISVYKMIQELMSSVDKHGRTSYHRLLERLPTEHKAKWFAGSAISGAGQSISSIISTALSRLNAFIDSEMETILCSADSDNRHQTLSIDVEKFCKTKSAVYLVLPEEDCTKHFLVSLIFQQLYREMLTVADENDGKLDKRVMFYADEIGTLPKIESLEMIFSASRSRRISIVAIIQSLAQFEQKYGKEGSEIIIDNCQSVIFGSFAPNSKTAIDMSKDLGTQTVLSGSVSMNQNSQNNNRSLQMIERSLMTVDELKTLPKGHFIVMKTGTHPMKTRLELYFKWGIVFDKKYSLPERVGTLIVYANKQKLMEAVLRKHPQPAPMNPNTVEVTEKITAPEASEQKKANIKTTKEVKNVTEP